MEERRESTLQKDEIEKIKKADASVKAMEDFTSPEVLYDELISSVKKYHPSTDITMIEKAFNIANNAHKGQVRKSGEPYIIHPLCVAIILADLELDKETIVAGLLHDVVEDTVMTSEEIRQEFGDELMYAGIPVDRRELDRRGGDFASLVYVLKEISQDLS